MVSKDEKKLNRVLNFLKNGLASLADDLEDTIKGINDFLKSLTKAQKDLKAIKFGAVGVRTVSTSSRQVVHTTPVVAKQRSAQTLQGLLGAPQQTMAPAQMVGGNPGMAVPQAAPPPSRTGLPPAPRLPPAAGAGGVPAGPPTATPAFARRVGPPTGPPSGPPTGPPAGPPTGPPAAGMSALPAGPPPMAAPQPAPPMAPQQGGGLGSLRDEMLDELTRLKKIMRGD